MFRLYKERNLQKRVTSGKEQIFCKKRLSIIPSQGSLVSDIPAGDGKTAILFYSVGREGLQ
jgi:hypothetical protein